MAERQRAKKESVDSSMHTHMHTATLNYTPKIVAGSMCVCGGGYGECACCSHVSLFKLEHLVSQDFSPSSVPK